MDLTVPDIRAVLDLQPRPSLMTPGDAGEVDEVLQMLWLLGNVVIATKVGREKVQGRLKEVLAL